MAVRVVVAVVAASGTHSLAGSERRQAKSSKFLSGLLIPGPY